MQICENKWFEIHTSGRSVAKEQVKDQSSNIFRTFNANSSGSLFFLLLYFLGYLCTTYFLFKYE